MNLAIVGATGNAGQPLVNEALARGHQVTAVARDVTKLGGRSRLTLATGDARQPESLAELLRGHDAVISSIGFRMVRPDPLIEAVRSARVKRYLVVGGAGSLQTASGGLHVDSPNFPGLYKEEATLGNAFLDVLRGVTDLDWTMLSPSAMFVPGERTGKFRLGIDALLTDVEGKSWISHEDYAVAMLDEIEQPRYVRRRFTVGY